MPDVETLSFSEIEQFIEANRNIPIKVRQGENVSNYFASDIKISDSTGRWKNAKTGHILSSNVMKDVYRQIKLARQYPVPRACLAKLRIKAPKTYKEAMKSNEVENRVPFMDEEMNSLKTNQVL